MEILEIENRKGFQLNLGKIREFNNWKRNILSIKPWKNYKIWQLKTEGFQLNDGKIESSQFENGKSFRLNDGKKGHLTIRKRMEKMEILQFESGKRFHLNDEKMETLQFEY